MNRFNPTAAAVLIGATVFTGAECRAEISVEITFPTRASTVVNPVPIDAALTGSGKVDRVEFSIDGVYRATDSVAPYHWTWDSSGYSGDHTITVRAYELGTGVESETSLTVTIQPVCRANFDGVGGVQAQDIFAFLEAWFISDPRTDMDGSGVINAADIFAFIDAWFVGCP